jgi:hypothetical protein
MECRRYVVFAVVAVGLWGCKKGSHSNSGAQSFSVQVTVNNVSGAQSYTIPATIPVIRFTFSAPLAAAVPSSNFSFFGTGNAAIPFTLTQQNADSVVIIQPKTALSAFSAYTVSVSSGLLSAGGGHLSNPVSLTLTTTLDSTDKFPRISDSALLTLVEQQTFKYFWDFGEPTSGMARERNTSGETVTTGGSGFGVMSMLVGVYRNFITRAQGLARVQQIVTFLKDSAQRYHGAFPHWIDGSSGNTVPFSTEDDGADLVETAYMMQGLLSARQFFNGSDPTEIQLRADINTLWTGVDWNWFQQNGQNTLYWHWSPDYAWSTNQQISGWSEALITYVLAASAPVDSISKAVYTNGWAGNGSIRNGKAFYGVTLPLGPDYGGPLFFSHYSFLGLNPHGLSDAYANYWVQDTAQATINYLYCVTNPHHFNGYSSACWGLTASDDNISGYDAHSPTDDLGVISPTAAIASLPYTPTQSMNALRFFYYTLGDKLWGQYGFVDAFNLTNVWFATSYLAIDQGPEIIMIENYRSGLLWNLFMSCPEVKSGLQNLGFQVTNH